MTAGNSNLLAMGLLGNCRGTAEPVEYAAEFQEMVAQVWDWPESVKVQFFCGGLNVHLVKKSLIQNNPQILLGWIQLAFQVENHEQLVVIIRQ